MLKRLWGKIKARIDPPYYVYPLAYRIRKLLGMWQFWYVVGKMLALWLFIGLCALALLWLLKDLGWM